MLVLNNHANFSKKSYWYNYFECNQGIEIRDSIKKAIHLNKPQTLWLNSIGKNSNGHIVSSFKFEWTLKPKI